VTSVTSAITSLAIAARLAGSLLVGLLLLSTAVPADAQAPRPWRHGIIAPKSDAGFLLMEARHGFAAQEGLKLELLEVKDDQIGLKGLLAGELESYEGGVQGAIAADVRGGDVKIIGCHWPLVPHGLMVKGGVVTMEALKGKSIAVSAPGSFPDMFARVALAKLNLSPADFVLAAIGGDRDRYAALVGGVVDAAVVSNEYLPLAASRNFKMLLSASEVGENFVRICTFSTARVLAARHEDAVRYLAAQSKALHFALSHREETLALTRQEGAMAADDPRPAYVFDDAVRTRAIAPDLPIPMDKIGWMRDQLVQLGQIPNGGDLAAMVDLSVRVEAMKRAGE
jgi:NitT/TauT family transport system substrate-binding protein